MDRTFNSTGSHIFFEFGKQLEFVFPNGKKGTEKEWSIWIGHVSWRISQHDKYVMGSGENLEIKPYIERLLGTRFKSLQFISQFLDAEFEFENGYKIVTFFNWSVEDQLVIFTPDKVNMSINCSNKDDIESIQSLSKKLKIYQKYKKSEFPLHENFDKIIYSNHGFSLLAFKNVILTTGNSAWRITKNNEYIIGRRDYYFGIQEGKEQELKANISQLIGKKIKSLEIDDSGMDARFQFDDGYDLEVFTTAKSDQWGVSQNENRIIPR
jgi:hypothetical protein